MSAWTNPHLSFCGQSVFRKVSGDAKHRMAFAAWLASHALVLGSTVAGIPGEEAWTREANRRRTTTPIRRSQIDVIVCSESCLQTSTFETRHDYIHNLALGTSDHAPVSCRTAIPEEPWVAPNPPPSLKGWEPDTATYVQEFHDKVDDVVTSGGCDCSNIEDKINIYHGVGETQHGLQ